jgi:hypothetical protein
VNRIDQETEKEARANKGCRAIQEEEEEKKKIVRLVAVDALEIYLLQK